MFSIADTNNTKESIITSTDIALNEPSAELEALLAQQEDEIGDIKVTIPIIKVGQDLTAEVKSGDAEVGEYINSMSGESYGDAIGFIVSYFQLGRFAALKDGRAFVAFGKDPIIPEAWEPVVGTEWIGQPFSEHPEAEEKFKAAVDAKERQWDKGPEISTTWNFTGHVIVPGDDPEDEPRMEAGRLSLKRTDVPAAKKFHSLKNMMRLKAFWDYTYELTTKVKTSGRHESYIVQVKSGRPTTNEERLIAVQLAQDVAAQRVTEVGGEAEVKAPVPAPEGALGLGDDD